ncbi:hypothetical protein CL614_05790 [archaeon]|jgi:hypothetical protein|nr:hypothetical protein [archaeon]|tara:strand:+ start:4056 stop:5024 length:969 start_codon:yes stop_codon:yes gene_type:complete
MTKLFEPISKESLIDEINNYCNTTNESYPNRRKITNINKALDQYWYLAAQSSPQLTFDDTGQAALPVETQNLVDGTNAYKMTAFTNKVLQIVRVAVLDDNGKEQDLWYEDFDAIPHFQETYDAEIKGIPGYWTKRGDFIYIRNTPNYASTGGLKVYVSRELSKFAYVDFTTTFGSDLFNATAHGLAATDGLLFVNAGGAIPGGITAESTIYYVIASGLTSDAFKVSTTSGGSTITLSDDGTGNHKFIKVFDATAGQAEPGIPVIHHDYLARYAALEYMDTKHPKFAKLREQLAIDSKEIQDYWQSAIKPSKTIIETSKRLFK